MKIPSNNQWTQTNDGSIFGVLNETHNINFDQQGEAMLGKKTITLIDDADDADFGVPIASTYALTNYYVATDEKVFTGDFQGGGWSEAGSGPTVSEYGDILPIYDLLYVTIADNLSYYNGGTWTNSVKSLSSNNPHPMAVFDSLPTYKLAIGNGGGVMVLDSSHNEGTALSLPDNTTVQDIVYRNGYLYVAARRSDVGDSAIYLWNGNGSSAQYSVPIAANNIFCLLAYRESVICVTSEGEILLVTGTSTQRLAAFPVFYQPGARWQTALANTKMRRKGIVALGDNIYMNINGKVDTGEVYGMKSGIWCYDPSIGLYHMASATTDKLVSDSGVTQSSSTLTTAATHNLTLGDAVTFSSVSGITGISNNVVYYAIPTGNTTLQIAGSLKNAYEGNNITLSGTATTDTIHYAPNTDQGNLEEIEPGFVALTGVREAQWHYHDSEIFFGYNAKTPGGTNRDCLGILAKGWTTGSLVTQKLYTSDITQTWKRLAVFIAGVLGSNEKAIVKYQSKNRQSFPSKQVSVTWSDADTFTCTDNAVYNIIEVGDEVQIYSGYGQGRTAHVSSVSFAGGTATVNLDESWGNATDTATVVFTGFKKLQEIVSTRANETLSVIDINTVSPWVQVKVEFRGFEPKLAMFELSNGVDESGL